MTAATAVRYTLDNPPPKEPPTELGLTRGNGLGIWRVMQSTWMEHRPVDTPKGRRCQVPACGRPWGDEGCPGHRAAASTLEHLHQYPQGEGLVGYDPMPVVLREDAPRLTRTAVPS